MQAVPWVRSRLLHGMQTRGLAKKRGWGSNWIGTKGTEKKFTTEELRILSTDLKAKAKKLGLPLAFVTSAKASSRLKEFEDWLQKGYNGEMGYMARADRVARRRDPSLILPGVQSVVMVGLPYWPGASKFPAAHAVPPPPDGAVKAGKVTEQTGAADTNSGVVSSYAWGGDYHAILDARLRSLGEWLVDRAGGTARYYADTGAVLERDFAARARMGFIGKNSLLIHPQLGSGVFLGALLTTTALPVDGDEEEPPRKGKPGCGKCTKCMDFCPTRAIVSDRVVDARRCISYLTIELAGSIPEALRRGMGARVYGCDICQQVCPWNRLEWSGDGPLWSEVGKDVSTPSLVGLLEMDEKGFRERFKGSAIARIGRDRLARNAAVALGNVGGRGEMARVEEAAEGHASELVREHARWAVGEIRARVRVGGDDRSSAGDDAF